MEVNGLELLDKEALGLKASGFFKRTGTTGEYYRYDDDAVKKETAIYNLSRHQRKVYAFRFFVFNHMKIYSGMGEVKRRIAIGVYGDREQSKNIGNTLEIIEVKLMEAKE